MALQNSKYIILNILRSSARKKHFIPLISSCSSISLSSVHSSHDKVSRAMKAYIQKAEEYDKFMKKQFEEYNLGKKHLANIMGKDHMTMTQEDINKAIEYLLPSALFVPKARPFMKPPDQVYGKKKVVEFDLTGRPFHSLFYTGLPNFNQILHNAAAHLEKLDEHQLTNSIKNNPQEPLPKPLNLLGSVWMGKEELEDLLLEKLMDSNYDKFVEILTCLAEHPFASLVEDFIKTYRKELSSHKSLDLPKPTVLDDGSVLITIKKCKRVSAFADVSVRYPGTGIIKINNLDIDYFKRLQSREQASSQMSNFE